MRVLTHTGLVDVTDEHQLLDANVIMANASNVGIGDNWYIPRIPSTFPTAIQIYHLPMLGYQRCSAVTRVVEFMNVNRNEDLG